MQNGKKYYLNVSSYKYKRDCMKLLSQSLDRSLIPPNNSEIITEFQNLCPGGKHCKNFGIILYLDFLLIIKKNIFSCTDHLFYH